MPGTEKTPLTRKPPGEQGVFRIAENENPEEVSAPKPSGFQRFWKAHNDSVLKWGCGLLILVGALGLWAYCGRSFTGVWHFVRNGFSLDGAFETNPVRAGEFGGQKRVLKLNGTDCVFRWCPRGVFRMGSPENERGRREDEARHRVSLTGFWILETEVTREMWVSVMGGEPLPDAEKRLPVTASWSEAEEFCEKLGRKLHYRVQLPTEAQWEYACRATSDRPFYGELNRIAWHQGNSKGKIRPVKKRRGNLWFLYDFQGNVWEWCRDRYDSEYYYHSPETDPQGPSWGRWRVVRGGSFDAPSEKCRASARDSQRYHSEAGFRVVVEYVPPPRKRSR